MTNPHETTQENFYGLGIAPGILDILNSLKFITPTPIQKKAIPVAITGKDVVGIAQTGTGKTLSFAIPMIQGLSQQRGRGLVLVPTRELAFQVQETYRKLCPAFGLKSVVLVGGESIKGQTDALRADPRIIIATPGRLIDHVMQHHIRLDDVIILVLDEADRMLDMGFAPQIELLLKLIPKERQTMLFSATMPDAIMTIASKQMQLPVSIEIARSGTTADLVSQEMFIVKHELKPRLLDELLKQYAGSVLLFVRTKIGARKIAGLLRKMGHRASEIHADRSMSQRKEALHNFKMGKCRILVATDIAARGIDVTGIELVINYDLPDDPENYVHRIGRTGRAGKKGHAISLATPDQKSDVENIEKIIRSAIPRATHPRVPAERFSFGSKKKHSRPQQAHHKNRKAFFARRHRH